MKTIIKLRHHLHQYPELSGSEGATAQHIIEFFKPLKPDSILQNLGGDGVAIIFSGSDPGPTVLLRCELDALPIEEINQTPHQSTRRGVAHQCGHDGHMSILAAVGVELAQNRIQSGRVVLLYQPAEETGTGAEAVVNDPQYLDIKPDYAFALHNVPGFPMGQVILRRDVFSSASRGVAIQLTGSTAHAAQPETGVSPAKSMCDIIERLSALPAGIADPGELAFATVVGSRLGEKAFGTAPGSAEIWATLRCETNESMARVVDYVEGVVKESATAEGLQVELSYEDVFNATVNSDKAVDIIEDSAGNQPVQFIEKPFRWSEDFGQITATCEGALFGLGSGVNTPDLHNPDYDFPDELIPIGADIFMRIIQQCLAEN